MDKLSKLILDTLINSESDKNRDQRLGDYVVSYSDAWSGSADSTLENFSKKLGYNSYVVLAAERYLISKGYLEYQKDDIHTNVGFYLSHKGRHYRYFERIQLKQYLADNWIGFFTLATSVPAFIISIIALSTSTTP